MSYHEKKNIVSIISTLVIFGLYSLYVFQKYQAGGQALTNDFNFWASVILVFIPVSIVANIIINIVFVITYRITTNEEEPSFSDERDKLIELKALRNSHWVFVIGFLLSMVLLVIGMPPFVMFIILAVSGLASEMVGNISQLYFYRRGI